MSKKNTISRMADRLKRPALLVWLGLCLLCTACSTTLQAKDLLESYTPQEVSTQQSLESNFAFDLFSKLYDQKNLVLSPFSVLMVLSMAQNGMGSQTLAQSQDVLQADNESLNRFFKGFSDRFKEQEGLNIADSIWLNESAELSVNTEWLQTIRNYYEAQVYEMEFDSKTPAQINLWVSEKTGGMIDRLLEELDDSAAMVLLNAMSFEREWSDPYLESQVQKATFTNLDGTDSEVDMMYSSESVYLEDETLFGFVKYYKDSDISFAALLPKEKAGFESALRNLSMEQFEALLETRSYPKVYAALPKFSQESECGLNEVLEKMGMIDAFDQDLADFKPLATSPLGNLYVSEALSKSIIDVNESGTKAAAASAEILATESALEIVETREVVLDRPFIWLLFDEVSHQPLFIGTVCAL